MTFMKIGQVGTARECSLPEHVAKLLRAKEGDFLLIEQSGNGFKLTVADADTAADLELYENCARRYGAALKALTNK